MDILDDKLKRREAKSSQYYGLSNTYHGANLTPRAAVSQQTDKPLIGLLAEPHIYQGYVSGYRQPIGLITLRVTRVNALQLEHLQKICASYLANVLTPVNAIVSVDDVARCFGEAIGALQTACGFPIFEAVQCQKVNGKDSDFNVLIPTLFAGCFHQVTAFLLKLINHHASLTSFVPEVTWATQMSSLVRELKMHAPQGTNSLRFIKAAYDEHIPWTHVAINTFQYGYGIHSRWFDSSTTDLTSQMSISMARDKINTSRLLRRTGFPVPDHVVVHNETGAVASAIHLGYPVVVKPLDQDGGKGVYAKLVSDQGVKKAYQQAKHFSSAVIVEKHVVGKDYRLLVVDGTLIWAIERIPAGVTGDGLNTISALVKINNQHHEYHFPLRHINITDDTHDFLAEQGFDLMTIPRVGQFIALNRIANISTGGTPVGVLDSVHPDNKQLAESVAKLFRLDIAGIDFISLDIQQSYLENDGKIIEVNAQPQLGSTTAPHIYRQILSTLVPHQGRIPIIVVCGDSENQSFSEHLQSILSQHYRQVGKALGNKVVINGETILRVQSLFEAGQFLLLQKDLDVMVFCIHHQDDIVRQGLPFDRYDTLFFFRAPLANEDSPHETFSDVLGTLFKACQGNVVLLETALGAMGNTNQQLTIDILNHLKEKIVS